MIGIIFPVLSLAIIEKGLDYFQLGILMAVYSGVTVLLELPTGGLADSIGRKRVYLFSLVASLSGGVSFYLAGGFPLMIIAFALMGSGRALSSGSIESLFIDRIYEHDANADIQGTMALVHAAIPVSLGLASLIGGLLPDFFEPMSSAAVFRDRYSANILAFLLIGIIQAGYTIACIEEKPRQKGLRGLSSGFRETPRVIADSFRFGLRNPTILLLLAGGFAWGFSISGLEQFWQPRVTEIGGEGLPSASFRDSRIRILRRCGGGKPHFQPGVQNIRPALPLDAHGSTPGNGRVLSGTGEPYGPGGFCAMVLRRFSVQRNGQFSRGFADEFPGPGGPAQHGAFVRVINYAVRRALRFAFSRIPGEQPHNYHGLDPGRIRPDCIGGFLRLYSPGQYGFISFEWRRRQQSLRQSSLGVTLRSGRGRIAFFPEPDHCEFSGDPYADGVPVPTCPTVIIEDYVVRPAAQLPCRQRRGGIDIAAGL
jgi:hypothetical protein